MVAVGDQQALLVIGDVSGHGIDAATTMAMVRHATLAYVAQDHRPGVVLGRLSAFVSGINARLLRDGPVRAGRHRRATA